MEKDQYSSIKNVGLKRFTIDVPEAHSESIWLIVVSYVRSILDVLLGSE